MAGEAGRVMDLPEAHRQQVLEIIRRRLPDATVWVYGSRARGHARRYSDLDLMLDNRGVGHPTICDRVTWTRTLTSQAFPSSWNCTTWRKPTRRS